MPSLILHIGSAKTGTTSIQHFLAHNRQALLERGFVVPTFLGVGPNHRWLPLLAQDGGTVDGFATRQGLHTSPQRLRDRLAAKRMELEQAAAATADTTWIISSEQLHSRLSTVDLLRLRRLLEPLFAEIRVVVYVRQPLSTAISAWSTRTRSGRVAPGLEPPQSFAPLCDHAVPLRRWRQVFGRERLQVRRFHPADLRGGSLLDDFSSGAGIGSLAGLWQPAPVNRSLSYQAIKVLWHLQEHWRNQGWPTPAPGHLQSRQRRPPRLRRGRADPDASLHSPCGAPPSLLPDLGTAAARPLRAPRHRAWIPTYRHDTCAQPCARHPTAAPPSKAPRCARTEEP